MLGKGTVTSHRAVNMLGNTAGYTGTVVCGVFGCITRKDRNTTVGRGVSKVAYRTVTFIAVGMLFGNGTKSGCFKG